MKKQFRLKRNEEISRIVHEKRFVSNQIFSIYYDENDETFSRVCVSVSKKMGIAVVRNKIKRQVREMVDKIFDFSLSKDYVVVVRQHYLDNNFQENYKNLENCYLKIQGAKI